MPAFAPRIRVEVYIPIRYEPAYQDTLTWLIEEFTELRGVAPSTRILAAIIFLKATK
ncbi:MAG: hypothetical protein H0U60_07060 [Blastocatellia bacterium]|nr:hypothetical protein [Blastocatellia bacterium]